MNEIILATNFIPPRHYTGISIQFVILIALLVIIVWLLKEPKKTPYTIHEGDSALDILNKRYAFGELTKDQYESIRQDIGETGQNPAKKHIQGTEKTAAPKKENEEKTRLTEKANGED